jgi:hypothetical protein
MEFSINTPDIAKTYKLNFKTDENLIIVYDDDIYYDNKNHSNIKNNYKSVIFDIKTNKPIATQYNKIIYGFDNVDNFIKNNKHSKMTISKCYEGTHLIVFFHNNIWYVCTRKCLDANKVFWNENISYYTMFTEAMLGKFTFDDLDKNYCYHFNLIHYMNHRNIIYTSEFGEKYKILNLVMVTEKETMKIVDKTLPNVFIPNKLEINDASEVKCLIDKMIKEEKSDDIYLKNEGYVINHFDDNNNLTILKVYTPFYEFMYNHTSNTYGFDYPKFDICCNAYINPSDELTEIAVNMFEDKQKYKLFMKKIIDNYSIIAYTCNALYFITLKKANPRIYNALSASYKKIIYAIHGLYLTKIKTDSKFKININEVLNILKCISVKEFKELLSNYINVIENTHNFNRKEPIDQIYYPTLMFK